MEQYEALAETLNRAGEQCLETGVQLCYHNHDFEFTPIDGTLPYDLLLELTEPALLAMELDLFWICKAGLDPLDYFARYPGRFPLCHVKDMQSDGSMAAVGSGELGFANILTAARRAGVRHYFVEHDQPSDPMASVSESYQALMDLRI